MRIEEIEIHGFKSFAQKTIIRLDEGISGIVGPNGSGKSNVVDAIKWCLGEQSAKSLRGNAMSDLIFNGTQKRKSQNFAEVAITLSRDEDESFPADYERFETLRISRKINREGSSNYSINMAKVRLKDIQNILIDTGLSNQNYSFIEQGQIGEIVKAKPQETRELIEEAAGISRFKHKKELSLAQLSSMENNIYALNLLIESQTREQRKLERQAKKTILYQRQFLEYKKYAIASALGIYVRNIADRKVLSQQLKQELFQEEDTTNRYERQQSLYYQHQEKLGKDKEVLEQVRIDIQNIRKSIDVMKKKHNQLQLELVRHETLEVNYQNRFEEIVSEIHEQKESLQKEQHDLEITSIHFQGLDQDYKDLSNDIEIESKIYTQLSNELQVLNKEFHSNNQKIIVNEVNQKNIANQIPKIEQNLQNLHANQHFEQQLQDLEDKKQTEEANIETCQQELETCQSDFQLKREEQTKLQASLKEMQKKQTEQKIQYQKILSKFERTRAQKTSLETLIESKDGLDSDIQDFLQYDCVLGVVAGELQLSEEQEGFAKIALGEYIDALIVDVHKLSDDFWIALKNTKSRTRCIFIDMTVSDTLSTQCNDFLTLNFPSTKLGKHALEQIFFNLTILDNVPQDSLSDTLMTTPKAIFTEQGWVLQHGCLVTGTTTTSGSTILSQKRMLKKLQTDMETQQTEVQNKQRFIHNTDIEIETHHSQIRVLTSAVLEFEAQTKQIQQRIKNHRSRIQDLDKNIEEIKKQQKFYLQQRHSLQEDLQKLKKDQIELIEQKERTQALLIEIDNQRHEKRSEYTQRNDLLQSQRQKANHIKEQRLTSQTQCTNIKNNIKKRESQIQKMEQTQQQIQMDMETTKEFLRESQKEDDILENKIKDTQSQLMDLEVLGQDKQIKYDAEIVTLQKINEMLQQLNDQKNAYRQQRIETEQKLTTIKADNLQMRNDIEQQFHFDLIQKWSQLERNRFLRLHLTLPYTKISNLSVDEIHKMLNLEDMIDSGFQITEKEVLDDTILQEWIQNRDVYKEKISLLQDINHLAPQEYIEVAQKCANLIRNKDDLEQSAQQIRASIEELDQIFQQKFKETFDEVNENFQIFYPRLVGGGFANLQLTEPHNLLETGVGIFAQPPGKKLQLLSLLSGGEKALVAISLLFSLFKVRPSPFCLLDEVDAPLDEGNGSRFNSILLEMSQHAQFIVVTHNKKTMEVATILYGISMPEPGVSNLVSVRIDDVSD